MTFLTKLHSLFRDGPGTKEDKEEEEVGEHSLGKEEQEGKVDKYQKEECRQNFSFIFLRLGPKFRVDVTDILHHFITAFSLIILLTAVSVDFSGWASASSTV